jgi:hypothetical protein
VELNVKNTPFEALLPYLDSINNLYRVYVKVMQIKKNRDNLHAGWRVVAWIYVTYGYIRDIWFNLTTASKIFNDSAQELTFTARLKRYRKEGDKEQEAIAEFLCDQWLDQVDPSGDHC